jgi:hypothetical protein
MENFGTVEKSLAFLESLGWDFNPWDMSHQGAGYYAAMALCCDMPMEWHDAYFDWLAANVDQETGIGREGAHNGKISFFLFLLGFFHYMFNHFFAFRLMLNVE